MTLRRFGGATDRLLAILCTGGVALVLFTPYVPTQDGPSHVYSAFVLSHLSDAPYSGFYQADWSLIPNLGGGILLMLLGQVVQWVWADKVTVLLASLLFIAGSRWLCRLHRHEAQTDTPWIALLAVPYALSGPLFYGFYSYSLGIALVPWIWGLASSHSTKDRSLLGLLLLLCLTCHAAACLVALIGAIMLGVSSHRRDVLTLVIAITPAASLLGAYVLSFPTDGTVYWEPTRLIESVLMGRGLLVFDGAMEWTSLVCMACAFTAAVVAGGSMRVVALAISLATIYLVLPDGGSEHWFLSLRLSLLPTFALLLIGARLAPTHRWYQILITIAVTAHIVALADAYADASQQVEDYVALEAHIPDGAHIAVVDDMPPPPPSRHNPLLHAVGWIAIQRGGVDITSYEPHRAHFQLKLKKYNRVPDPNRLMRKVDYASIQPFLSYADTVLYRSESPLKLPRYVLHAEHRDVHVFVDRDCARHSH